MNKVLAVAGIAFLFFGIGTFTNIIPLSVLPTPTGLVPGCPATVPGTAADFQCNSQVTVSIPATNYGVSPYTVWFVFKNGAGQSVGVQSTTSSMNPGTTQQFNGLVTVNGGPGGYLENVFVVDSVGSSLSATVTQAVNIVSSGYTLQVTIAPGAPAPTLVPSGTVVTANACTGTTNVCPVYNYAPGTAVSVTTTATSWTCQGQASSTCSFSGWSLSNGQGGLLTSTSSATINFTVNSNLNLVEGFNGLINSIVVYAGASGVSCQNAASPVSPSSVTLYQSASDGPQSQVFTAASCTSVSAQGASFEGWILGTGFDKGSAIGNSSSTTITFQQLVDAGFVASNNPQASKAWLTAQYKPGASVVISASPGITTTPAPGDYNPPLGAYSVSESAASGYCFTQWIVNGQDSGNSASVSVNLQSNQVYIISAVGLPASSVGGSCSNVPPPSPAPSSFTGQLVGIISSAGGVGLLGLSLRKKR